MENGGKSVNPICMEKPSNMKSIRICIIEKKEKYDCAHVSIGNQGAFIRYWPKGAKQWEEDAVSPDKARRFIETAALSFKTAQACRLVKHDDNNGRGLSIEDPGWEKVFNKLRNILERENGFAQLHAGLENMPPERPNNQSKAHRKLNNGMLHGVAYFIDKWLDVEMNGQKWREGNPPCFAHKSTYDSILRIKHGSFGSHCHDLIKGIVTQIEANRYTNPLRRPADCNWRWKKQTDIARNNRSAEVNLERSIVRYTDDNWVNQMPIASGFLSTTNDKGRHVDLVQRLSDRYYRMMELKVRSDNPFFAAMEILCYGLLFVYSKKHRDTLGFKENTNPILWSKHVMLCILAPAKFYPNDFELDRLHQLESSINMALKNEEVTSSGVKMEFQYCTFAADKADIFIKGSHENMDRDQLSASMRDLLNSINPLFKATRES